MYVYLHNINQALRYTYLAYSFDVTEHQRKRMALAQVGNESAKCSIGRVLVAQNAFKSRHANFRLFNYC